MKNSTLLLIIFISQFVTTTLFKLDIYTAVYFVSIEHSELVMAIMFCSYIITNTIEGKKI